MRHWKTKIFLVLVLSLLVVNDCDASTPTNEEVLSAINEAKQENAAQRLADIHKRARRNSDGGVKSRCPFLMSAYHGTAATFNKTKALMAEDTLKATKLLVNKGYTLSELQTPDVTAIFQTQIGCSSPPVTCDQNQVYRTIDGSCNNPNNPSWGMAGTAEMRDLDIVAYDDGLDLPRTRSFSGGPLPSPRTISNIVHDQPDEIFSEDLALTMFTMGQFLDHDLGLTDEAELNEDCCAASETMNPNCFNIEIDGANDNIQNGANCMPFIRSAVSPPCGPGHREQPNSITHFIDCSNIYGSTSERLAELRVEDSGFLKMQKEFNKGTGSYWRLPDDPSPDLFLCESDEENGFFCSLTGDIRANDVPTLTGMHQMGVREHNRIAWKLKKHFKDPEVLFQEARKILIAEYQHIIYNEFLPKILSPDKMDEYGLWSTAPYQYDENLNPSLANEFLIAYRFHTWIPQFMKILTRDYTPVLDRQGRIDPECDKITDDTYFTMDMTYFHKRTGSPKRRLQGLDGLLHYVAGTTAQANDRFMVDAIRNALFKDPETNTALDLVAFNIQRARDHGLPSYNEYRKFCGLSTGQITCDDLTDHDAATRELLRTAYNNECNDIDLWVGAHSEMPAPGAVVGPLLQCILGRQFRRLKYADRFWHQNTDAGFTPAQLAEIQKASLARLLCDNMNFRKVGLDSFAKPDSSNFVDCSAIPRVNLFKFRRSMQQEQGSGTMIEEEAVMEDDSIDSGEFLAYLESLEVPS